jgi:predicted GNAT family acetyltransferase
MHLTFFKCPVRQPMSLSTLNLPLPALEDLITPTPQPLQPIPRTPTKKKLGPRLSRDIRRDILLLRELNDNDDEIEYTYERIAVILSKRHKRQITLRAVQYTVNKNKATPQKEGRGRKPTLATALVDEIEAFVIHSRVGRQATYLQLGELFDISPNAVKYALRKRGYSRRVALRKPPISEKNRLARLAWAHEHKYWTEAQWDCVFWTDETWVNPGRHRKTWVTRKAGEELLSECVIDKIPKKIGWMFWGSFSGSLKGPGFIWEKDWGSINATSYQEHTVPIIHGWLRLNPTLVLMQDGAPGHKARKTIQELNKRGIYLIF